MSKDRVGPGGMFEKTPAGHRMPLSDKTEGAKLASIDLNQEDHGLIERAVVSLKLHMKIKVTKRRKNGRPTCGDNVAAGFKLAALGEEFGEISEILEENNGHEPTPGTVEAEMLVEELRDLAGAACQWAEKLEYRVG